jgi:hypothetical protein
VAAAYKQCATGQPVKSFAASTTFFLAAAPFLPFADMQRTEEEWSVRVWTLLGKQKKKRLIIILNKKWVIQDVRMKPTVARDVATDRPCGPAQFHSLVLVPQLLSNVPLCRQDSKHDIILVALLVTL